MREVADDTGLQAALSDEARLAALERLQLLDTPAERVFDRLTAFTARELGVPVVLVTLVTEDRQFFKSACGLPPPWDAVSTTPLSHSFCQYVVAQDEALVVVDARRDRRLQSNLAIEDVGVVAYAGFPLRARDGEVLGSFCALDFEPRTWVPHELEFLRDMAATAMDVIELRAEAVAAADAAGRLQQVLVPAPPQLRRGAAWAAYRPGEQRLLLGGDFFACTELDDGRLGLMIGDVAGHGPEAAGYAAGLRAAWQALELTEQPLERLVATLNRVALTQAGAEDRYATALFCLVAADRRSAQVVIAGHPPLVLLHADGAAEVDGPGGPPLGVLPEARWPAASLELPPDARLLLYTDGLTEARSCGGGRVGTERLLYELDRLWTGGRDGDELLEGVLALAAGEPATDDVALLLVRPD